MASSNGPVAEHREGDQDVILAHKGQGPSLGSKTHSTAPGRGATWSAHFESRATLGESKESLVGAETSNLEGSGAVSRDLYMVLSRGVALYWKCCETVGDEHVAISQSCS